MSCKFAQYIGQLRQGYLFYFYISLSTFTCNKLLTNVNLRITKNVTMFNRNNLKHINKYIVISFPPITKTDNALLYSRVCTRQTYTTRFFGEFQETPEHTYPDRIHPNEMKAKDIEFAESEKQTRSFPQCYPEFI